jgi:hypothetical protein
MKKILAVLLSIILCAFSAPMIYAGESDTILVTMDPQATINITVNPSTWMPNVALGNINASDTDTFTLTNEDGRLMVDVTINASDSTGWLLGSSPAHNQFQLQYGAGASGAPNVTIGDAVTVHSSYGSGTVTTKMAKINDTDFIIAYSGLSLSNYIRVGRYIGEDITWVTSSTLTGYSYTYIDVAMLNATDFIVVGDNGYSYAKIGRLSGSSISWISTMYDFATGAATHCRVEKIDETSFIAAWRQTSSTDIYFRIGSYDGSWSWKDTVTVESGTQPSIAVLDDTYFALAFVNATDSNKPHVVIGNIQTNSVVGSSTLINNAGGHDVDLVKVNSTDFLILYSDTTNNGNYIRVGRYASGSLSIGSASNKVGTAPCNEVSIDMVSDYRFVAGADQGATYWFGGDVDGMSVTLGNILDGTPQIYQPSVSVIGLSSTKFVVAGEHSSVVNVYPGSLPEGLVWTNIGTSPASFVTDFLTTKDFGLKLLMPTSSNTLDVQYTTITFTATVN